MSRAVRILVCAALLSTAGPAGASAEDEGISAHLRALEQGSRGADVRIRLELNWRGQPAQYIPLAPTIEVADGATLRPGVSRSSFDGEHTRWSHDAVVKLPDTAGPWTVGPAKVTIKTRGQPDREVAAAAIRTGRPDKRRRLAGLAVGNGIVLSLALGFGLIRYRRLRTEELAGGDALRALLRRAEEAGSQLEMGGTAEALLEALLALRLALDGQGVENGELWTAAAIRERIERVKFGGEEIPTDECLQMLQQYAAAGNG